MKKQKIRNEVLVFSSFMEHKLKLNDHKGGWDEKDFNYLLEKLNLEVEELKEALMEDNYMDILLEAADVANFAMMIAWNALALTSKLKEKTNG